jgi:hypothetical protein
MANKFVRSSDGNDADDGTTWALADATLTGAAATDAAGDVIWVSEVHSESTAGAILLSWAGTTVSPTRILCGDDAAEPPTALATTATVETTGANAITVGNTGAIYVYGITFTSGVGDTTNDDVVMTSTATQQVYEQCTFSLASTGAGSRIAFCEDASGLCIVKHCTFNFTQTGHALALTAGKAQVYDCITTGSAITLLLAPSLNTKILFSGCNFSSMASSMNITNTTVDGVTFLIRNCKLPASWSGSVNSSTPGDGSVYELHNCDSGDTNYRYQRKTQFGIIDSDTTNVRTGGASDGVTPLSWKMASNADAEWNHQTLDTGEIVRWNETVGSALTATIEILHDSVTNMTNQQIWLEVQYLGTSGFPLGVFINDSSGDYLSSAADQTASSETWNTTGLTNPNKQKLSVTFTPQEKGFLHATIRVAMASKSVWVDPLVTVT